MNLFSKSSPAARRTITAFAMAVALAPVALRAQSINLTGAESPTSVFGKGSAATATYGQTFTPLAGFLFLQNFSFWLSNGDGVNAASLKFQAYVMQWDNVNGKATGSVLYTSAVQNGPTAASVRYDFATPSLQLNAGNHYIAFLSASGLFGSIAPASAGASMETSVAGTYGGGNFVFTDNGDNFSALLQPWDFAGAEGYESHFSANFTGTPVSVVPEPSSLMLLVAGLATTLLVARTRKRV